MYFNTEKKYRINRQRCADLFKRIRRDYPKDLWVVNVARAVAAENPGDWDLLHDRLQSIEYVCYICAPGTIRDFRGKDGALEAHRLQASNQWRSDAPKAGKQWRFFWEITQEEEDYNHQQDLKFGC